MEQSMYNIYEISSFTSDFVHVFYSKIPINDKIQFIKRDLDLEIDTPITNYINKYCEDDLFDLVYCNNNGCSSIASSLSLAISYVESNKKIIYSKKIHIYNTLIKLLKDDNDEMLDLIPDNGDMATRKIRNIIDMNIICIQSMEKKILFIS